MFFIAFPSWLLNSSSFLFSLWSKTRQSLWHLSPNPFNSISQQLLYHDSQSSGSSLSAPLPFVPSFYIPFHPLCVSSEQGNVGLISSERRGKSLWRFPFSRSMYMKHVASLNSLGHICKQGWHLSGSNYHAHPPVHLFNVWAQSSHHHGLSLAASTFLSAVGCRDTKKIGRERIPALCQHAELSLIKSTERDEEKHTKGGQKSLLMLSFHRGSLTSQATGSSPNLWCFLDHCYRGRCLFKCGMLLSPLWSPLLCERRQRTRAGMFKRHPPSPVNF